jgi:hypothetical protein
LKTACLRAEICTMKGAIPKFFAKKQGKALQNAPWFGGGKVTSALKIRF